ncbi:hypothetical protein [Pedobacter deserti]|uniref:hypothetical protein n=1 Tax=Pedobacter deserti TaxID=2817382 RepID=UPI00210CF7D7|nr:hypothetical protein [Pedobacter sp. SYSU D00382]
MRNLILLLLCTTTLGLVSCKKDTIIQETSNRTIIFNIQPDQWVQSPDAGTYTATIDVPEIDQLNVDIEGVLVYLDHPVNKSSYIQLPYTYEGIAYSYEHYEGGIKIDIQRSVYSEDPLKPNVAIRMKVVLIPSRDVT